MKYIVVTGGAGYIGSHTCKALAQAGYNPVVFDNLSTGHDWAVKWGPLVNVDLNDTPALCKALKQYKPEAVIHFAASAYVGESMDNPRKYYNNNVINAIHLLDAMLDNEVKNIVFSSSCAVYGIPASVPITEDTPACPINPYGETKRCIEDLIKWYGKAYCLNWIALRYFNAAGADLDGEIGESHDPEPHVFPRLIGAAIDPLKEFCIYGTDYQTPDGTAVRDYIHVADLATAHVAALGLLEKKPVQRAYNLGTGTGVSVMELVGVVEQVTGKKVRKVLKPRRAGDPPELVADADAAKRELGWNAQLSDVVQLMNTALQWHDSRK